MHSRLLPALLHKVFLRTSELDVLMPFPQPCPFSCRHARSHPAWHSQVWTSIAQACAMAVHKELHLVDVLALPVSTMATKCMPQNKGGIISYQVNALRLLRQSR
jgi:hypothetical protein